MRLVSVNEERDVRGRKKLHPVTQVLCPNALQLHGGHAHTQNHMYLSCITKQLGFSFSRKVNSYSSVKLYLTYS